MTGLEKIINKIQEEASSSARTAIAAANAQAAELVANAEAETVRGRDEALAQAKSEAAEALASAQAAAALARRRTLLAEKQRLINAAIDDAQKALCALPVKDYFELIERLAAKSLLPKSGQICFSSADFKRLPAGFDARLASIAAEKGGAISLAKEPRAIGGGFILVYHDDGAGGDIEINCSFEALFYAAHEALQDKVSALLFS